MTKGREGARLAMTAVVSLVVGALAFGVASTGSAAPAARPSNKDRPTVSGKPEVGALLVAHRGTWTNSPTDYDYQWRRCDENGNSCSSIGGATGQEYQLKAVDRGATMRVRVTARSSDGSRSATSTATKVVTNPPAPPQTTGCARNGTVAVGELSPPERLLVDRQEIEPRTVGTSTTAATVRFRVSACGGKPVQGALVYVTAVPYNQFSVPAEVATGADGYAQLDLGRLRGFPATNVQQLLVMFVRARKDGESVLGGISTRRLISFPVDLRR